MNDTDSRTLGGCSRCTTLCVVLSPSHCTKARDEQHCPQDKTFQKTLCLTAQLPSLTGVARDNDGVLLAIVFYFQEFLCALLVIVSGLTDRGQRLQKEVILGLAHTLCATEPRRCQQLALDQIDDRHPNTPTFCELGQRSSYPLVMRSKAAMCALACPRWPVFDVDTTATLQAFPLVMMCDPFC